MARPAEKTTYDQTTPATSTQPKKPNEEDGGLNIEIPAPYAPYSWHSRIDQDVELSYPEYGVIHQYVDWTGRSGPSPTVFHTHLGVTMVAWELARRGWLTDLRLANKTLAETPIELRHWTMGVAGPGVGKSFAATEMEKFLGDFIESFHNQGKSEPMEVPLVHLEGRSTTAGLFDILNEKCWDATAKLTPGIVMSTEASAPFCGAGDIPEILCELYDCRSTVERQVAHLRAESKKTGERYRGAVEEARLSAVFFTTPNGIEKIGRVLGTNLLEGGLYTRCNFVYPEVDPAKYFGLMFSRHKTHRAACLRSWVEWARWLDGVEAAGQSKIVEMAGRDNLNLRDMFLQNLPTADRDRTLDGSFMRLMMRARIVAAVFAMSRGDYYVSADDVDRAYVLVRESYRAIERIMPQANIASAPEAQAQSRAASTMAQRVRTVVVAAGELGCPHSDLLRKTHLSSQVVKMAVDELVDREEIKVEKIRTPGRSSLRYFTVSKATRDACLDAEDAMVEARTSTRPAAAKN